MRRLAVPAAVEGDLAPCALVEGDAAVAVGGAAVGAQVGLGVEGGGIILLFARTWNGLRRAGHASGSSFGLNKKPSHQALSSPVQPPASSLHTPERGDHRAAA